MQLFEGSGKFQQFTAAVIINILTFSYGMTIGWVSPAISQLKSVDGPVPGGPITDEGVTWLTGVVCLGGCFVTGYLGILAERLGRKKLGYLSAFPLILSWILTAFAPNSYWLLLGRFFAGFGGAGILFLAPMYVTEISSEDVRGFLGSLLVVLINSGILASFVAGPYLSYMEMALFGLSVPILFLLAFYFMPETPIYLVRQNRLGEAVRSLTFFKGNNKALVDEELAHLKLLTKNSVNTTSRKPNFFDLFKDSATIRGLIISIGLLAGQQLCGIFAMVTYSAEVFRMSGSSMSPDASAIVIGSIQVCGSFLSASLQEKAGRRLLIFVSSVGMAVCHVSVGLFCLCKTAGYDLDSIAFVPVLSLSCFMISYCLGLGPAPFVVTSEIFRPEFSGLGTSISYTIMWFFAFLAVKCFGNLMLLIGISSCFLLLGIHCMLIFFFAFFLVPETRGRKREDIVTELSHSFRSYTDPSAPRKQELNDTEQNLI